MAKKTVLVTGASSGIGKATAIELAQSGYQVYGAARRLDRLQALSTYGIKPVALDVSRDESIVAPDTYTVTVTDAHGCQATSTEIVAAEACEDLALVPTAITANNDGDNDTFRVLASDVASVQLNVYDMLGTPVFSTTDVKAATETGWDGQYQGKDVPQGWYIWTLQGTYINGKPLAPYGGQRGRLVLSR